MISHPQYAATPRAKTPLSWRWAVVLVVSALLHLVALEWANGHLTLPSLRDEPVSVITTVQLQAPVVTAPSPPPAIQPRPTVKPTVKPRHHHPVTHLAPALALTPVPVPDPAPDTPVAPVDAETPLAADDKAPAEPAAVEPQPPQTEAKADTPVDKQSAIRYKVDLPPSAELKYDVQKVTLNGATMHGSGTINWQSADGNYQVTGEINWLFITALNFKSEGVLDDYGIAPVLYSEKHFRRSETDTHFNRDERNSISFSSSTASYPRKGGEQDRGSIMWQLSGIGRGDREKFVPGAQIDLFVAGVRDGDIWSFLVVGPEEIEVGIGKTLAWHVVRTPRAGTYDQQIDIWLAPQCEWYPVKVRYTDKNRDYLDMSISSFHQSLLASTHADVHPSCTLYSGQI